MPLNIQIAKLSQDDWTCAAITTVFSPNVYASLATGIRDLEWTEAIQSFYRQREVNLRGIPVFENIFSSEVRSRIAQEVGTFFGTMLDTDFDVAAHKMIAGDFIGVHTDANDFGETHRLTVTMNESWSMNDGGVLLSLNGSSIKDVRDAWLPTANNGFLFEISNTSFHAVSPIVGDRPRYSLIFTFKRSPHATQIDPTWTPFPLVSDVECGKSTASHMGISSSTFGCPYQYLAFGNVDEFRNYVDGHLENAPSRWTYRHENSINVDEFGFQSKGPEYLRVDTVRQLRRIPPLIVVRRESGKYALVDGSHRLCYANDDKKGVGVVVFEEQ